MMRHWVDNKRSDEALMKAYARGRSDAFAVLYARHKDRLYVFVHRQCGNHAIAEELVHDTWMAVIRSAEHYQSSAKFVTWLFRIAQNRLVDYWRKHGPTANVITQALPEQLAGNDQTMQNAVLNDIGEALATLPANQLATLLLKIEGFTREEIAEITEAKPETVKSRLRYAKTSLQKLTEMKA